MVNPAPFRLCARCGAAMDTHLQESAGLRRTAPIQSPVPVAASERLNAFQRSVVAFFLAVLALGYLAYLLPVPGAGGTADRPAPAAPRGGGL